MSSLMTLAAGEKPVDVRWLWALRIGTLAFLLLSSAIAISMMKEWEDQPEVVLGILTLALVYGLILLGLRHNPPGKFCLAVAVALGSLAFVWWFLGGVFTVFRDPSQYRILSFLLFVGLAEGAYAATAVRIYYLMKKESGDLGRLLAGFAVLVIAGFVLMLVVFNVAQRYHSHPQADAVRSLRTINIAQITYASTYHRGYSPTLAALGPPAKGAAPSAGAANLIDASLSWGWGRKRWYRFTYTPGPRDVQGSITTYKVVARPVHIRRHANNSYYTDQTGLIRQTSEDRDATAEDPLLAG